jgi:hypothetical protein
MLLEECALVRRGLSLDQRERKIAAENDAAFARKAVGKACRQGTDSGDRHAAQCDANDENVKSVQATANFA